MKSGIVKDVLLIGHSFVYLTAFISLYWQIPGLYGENGLLPIASKFSCDLSSCKQFRSGINVLPTFISLFRLSPSYALQLLILCGILLASLSVLFSPLRNALTYFALFIVHSSAFNVGDVFLWFQWDTLLVEGGALCVLLAPLPFIGSSQADNISIFLIRWLVFRLMYASGVVKLTSHCPAWWSLTALNIHFESQCLPTWVAYYAHHVPEWLRRLSVATTFYIEIALPPMFLFPLRTLRAFSFYPQIFLMLCIMATGNYNFFNALYAIICFAIIIDSDEFKFSTASMAGRFAPLVARIGQIVSFVFIVASLVVFAKYFGLEVDGFTISSRIVFTKVQFSEFVDKSVLYMLYLGIAAFFAEIATAVVRFFTESHASRTRSFMHLIYVICVGSAFFSVSIVPFASLSGSAMKLIPKSVSALHDAASPYHLANSYGLFRRMTGFHGRPEVIVEGSYEPDGPWVPFNFYAKPLKLDAKPRFVLPHQPRLDWQMWFAALGAYQHNPFFISLVHHLFRNNSEVTYLMDHYPFKRRLPKFIRAHLYHYHYTGPNERGEWPKNYWKREFQEEYMPSITKDDPNVLSYLHQNGIVLKEKFRINNENFWLEEKLNALHSFVRSLDPANLVQSVVFSHLISVFTFSRFGY